MTEVDKRQVHIAWEDPEDKEGNIRFYTSEFHVEEIDEYADALGLGTRSAAVRYLLEIGKKSIIENDPRQISHKKSDATTIRELVPEGKENAVDVRDELIDIIETELLDIIDNDSKISRDGWKVYK